MSLLDALQWRYANKRMNGEKITEDQLNFILDSTRLAPSSFGLQPYKIFVIENAALKKQLQPAARNQPQIIENSHLLVFCVWEKITEKEVHEYVENIAHTRGLPVEALNDLKQYMLNATNAMTEEHQRNWASRQAYIALGMAVAAAAEIKIDTSPMEGFEPDKFDEILALKAKGLRSVVLCALGHRSAEDRNSALKKVRRSKELLFEFIR